MDYFDVPPRHMLKTGNDRDPYTLKGNIEIRNLSYVTHEGASLLSDISFSIKNRQHIALVGFSGSGKSTLARCLLKLYDPTRGQIQIGEKDLSNIGPADVSKNIGFVSQSPYIFNGTIEENLIYACQATRIMRHFNASDKLPGLDRKIEALQKTGLFVDVLRFGLNMVIVRNSREDMKGYIINIRNKFIKNFANEIGDIFELYDEKKFLRYSNLAQNIIFGEPLDPEFDIHSLHHNRHFLSFLNEEGLKKPLIELGVDLAEQSVNHLMHPPSEDNSFEKSILSLNELSTIKKLAKKIKKKEIDRLTANDRGLLLQLALRFIPGRHRMEGFSGLIEKRILSSRQQFKNKFLTHYKDTFLFFDSSQYFPTWTIKENILFGKMKSTEQEARDRVDHLILQLLVEKLFLEKIVELGMSYAVGSNGENLSGGQKQKLALARIFLKMPTILILDEATSGLDNTSSERIEDVLHNNWNQTSLISIVHRLDNSSKYDKIAVMKGGRISEMGSFEELIEERGLFYSLYKGNRNQ
jgi:ABC-type multidrug transport system ATPase subunit